jgi:hypothetical protein
MSIMPEGEALRQAVQWISTKRLDEPGADHRKLVEQACLKFNLSPLEADYLAKWAREQP